MQSLDCRFKEHGEMKSHSHFGGWGLKVHGGATFEKRNQELYLVLISRFQGGDTRKTVEL